MRAPTMMQKARQILHILRQRRIWALALWTAAIGGAGVGQSAELVGKATDASGQPIAGVQVWLVDTQRGIERSARTDSSGQYRIRSLPGAQLLWRTFQPGCRSQHGQLTLQPSQTLSHDLVLQPAQEYRLENEKLLLVIDKNGAVRELRNKRSSPEVNYVSGQAPGFWHLIFRRGECWENVVRPEAQPYRVEKPGPDRLLLRVDRVRFRQEQLPIEIEFCIRLEGDELWWTAKVENHSSELEITEFYFPEIGGLRTLGAKELKEYLYWPNGMGQRIADFANRTLRLTYPWPGSMAWMTLANGREGIYLAAYDDSFLSSELQAGPNPDQGKEPTLGFVKFPMIRPGETWTSKPYVVSCYSGSWHRAADKYRQWTTSWRRPTEKPQWVRNITGMFLVILKQQYGDVMWRYDELPELYAEAQRNGMNLLALFGWTEGGHDNQYPEYQPGAKMGGADALRRGIQQVQGAGGYVSCYVQGRLLDAEGAYFKSPEGQQVAARNLWGSPYFEQYNKYSHSSLLRLYSLKLQAIANPIHPQWRETLLKKALQVAQHRPNGILFDQIGGMWAYPAFDSPSGVKPTLAFPEGQQKLLETLRRGLREQYPEFGLLTEHVTDVYSQYVDFLHGAGEGFAPEPGSFPAMCRYVLPDVVVTSRNPMPRIDARRVNFALAYGFIPELEVRYRDDVQIIRDGQEAEKADYLRGITQFRLRYPELLLRGRYMDALGLEATNPAVTITSFASDNRRAVVAWNDTTQDQAVEVRLAGFRLVEIVSLDGPRTVGPQTLKPQEVAVWIFQSEQP